MSAGRVREKTERVQALGHGQHSLGRQKIVRRLESGHAAIRGGPDHRASGLLADGERHHARRDRGSGTARAPARRMFEVPRVPRRPRRPVGESGGHRFAEQDRPAAAHLANDRGVRGAEAAFVERRAVFGRHALRLDDVLGAKRNFGKRPVRRGPLGLHLDPRVNRRLEFPDALQADLQSAFSGGAIGLQPFGEASPCEAILPQPRRAAARRPNLEMPAAAPASARGLEEIASCAIHGQSGPILRRARREAQNSKREEKKNEFDCEREACRDRICASKDQ